jgi:hypothetical protein
MIEWCEIEKTEECYIKKVYIWYPGRNIRDILAKSAG